jgi:hypothetical protein
MQSQKTESQMRCYLYSGSNKKKVIKFSYGVKVMYVSVEKTEHKRFQNQ